MNAPRLAQADRLHHHVRAALDAADLDKVISTTDALDITSGERHGIVVISAPRLTFDGPFSAVQTEFQLHVIAGPADNYLAAWAVIDEIIQALVDGDINLKDGEPGAYQPRAGVALPSYTLTLNDLDDE